MPSRTRSRRHSWHKLPGISRHNAGRKPFYKEHRLTLINPVLNESPYDGILENNDFLFSAAVREMTLERASSFDEIAGEKVFQSIRWPNGSRCPRCGAANAYERARSDRGAMWDCRDCGTKFSLTSGTLFASRKVSIRVVLMLMAMTVGASPAPSLQEAAQALNLTFKSVWALMVKIRAAANIDVPEKPAKSFEIGTNRYQNGALYSTRTWWTRAEKDALRDFIERGCTPEVVAPALGRTASSMAWYARDMDSLTLPAQWTSLIKSKRIATPRRVALCYPFIAMQRPEHADLLALNALVPRAYPEHMRADICQEMMLAVIEGAVTIDEIKANRDKSAWFLKKFYMANYEASGRAVSLTGHEDDDRSYDEAASSVSAKEWHAGEVHERTKYVGAMTERFQRPTQIEDAWRSQINRVQRGLVAQGKYYNFGETADLVERDGYRFSDDPNRRRSHAFERAEERFGLRLDGAAVKAIITLIESGHGRSIQKVSERNVRMLIAFRGKELPIVYDPMTKTLITVLPRLPQHTDAPIKISGWRAPSC